MHPKNYKELLPAVAEALDMPEEDVLLMVKAYYKSVRSALSELKFPKVHVNGLGDFDFKYWKLNDGIAWCENFESRTRLTGGKKAGAELKYQDRHQKLTGMKVMIEDEQKRKELFKEYKKSLNEPEGKYYPGMEE